MEIVLTFIYFWVDTLHLTAFWYNHLLLLIWCFFLNLSLRCIYFKTEGIFRKVGGGLRTIPDLSGIIHTSSTVVERFTLVHLMRMEHQDYLLPCRTSKSCYRVSRMTIMGHILGHSLGHHMRHYIGHLVHTLWFNI